MPNLKKFHEKVLEISCQQEWDGWKDGETGKPKILCSWQWLFQAERQFPFPLDTKFRIRVSGKH